MNAGDRKDALNGAGFPVEQVTGQETPVGVVWTYLPPAAVASPEAQALIASFDAN